MVGSEVERSYLNFMRRFQGWSSGWIEVGPDKRGRVGIGRYERQKRGD